MLIDSHVHVWRPHPDFAQAGATIVSPHSPIPVELLDAYLDEHGLSRAVLVQPIYPGEDNSYVADCARARPDRYAAVCVVDPRQSDAAERLAYWVGERGCRGLRLRPRIAAESAIFSSPEIYPIWEKAAELRIVMSVMGGPEHLATLKSLARRYASVPIVVDHLGLPTAPEGAASPDATALCELVDCGNVSVKLSGYYYYSRDSFPFADCHAMFRAVLERFGPSRVLWGSDFPHALLKLPYARALRVPELAFPQLNSADREQILGGNARRLYWR